MGSPALHIAGNTAQPPVSMLPWTFALQTNSREAEKRIRQTRVLLRIFVCFDIFILIGGILNLVWITPTSENLLDMQHTFVYCTVAFFSLTLICNSLAIHGISKQKRLLLLPWLVIFLVLNIPDRPVHNGRAVQSPQPGPVDDPPPHPLRHVRLASHADRVCSPEPPTAAGGYRDLRCGGEQEGGRQSTQI